MQLTQEQINIIQSTGNIKINAVAGSGKTTTLIEYAKARPANSRILYLAFNKGLVSDIEGKLDKFGIRNMEVRTFDSLLYKIYTEVKGFGPSIVEIKPQLMDTINDWFKGKAFKLKRYFSLNFVNFCTNVSHTNIEQYCIEVLGKKKAHFGKNVENGLRT